MIHILTEGYDIDAPWIAGELKSIIRPEGRVLVVALSFRDAQVKSAQDWDALYSREHGRYYGALVDPLKAYGIDEGQIGFIHAFSDTPESALAKVRQADVLYFPGGLPDRMMERIEALGLTQAIKEYRGVMLGYSAGAMIQFSEYHISPDDDYPAFGYYRGLGRLSGFYFEPHYEGWPAQEDAIRRVLSERHAPVYATHAGKGALIVEDGAVRTVGKVDVFWPQKEKQA